MHRFVDKNSFDTNLFKFPVGFIEIEDADCDLLLKSPTIQDILHHAHTSGYKLVYVFAPLRQASENYKGNAVDLQIPGRLVDVKTMLQTSIFDFDYKVLTERAFTNKNVKVRKHVLGTDNNTPSKAIRDLAVASGVYSRFKVDKKVPEGCFEFMFEAWIKNSLNRSIADEIFIAYDAETDIEVGFVTVKRRGTNVNIGLLAVDANHRRKGIAFTLLSRAALWALEEMGTFGAATINVVTQGENVPAMQCYESFGFKVKTTQDVYHVWLPDNLSGPLHPADSQSLIPFCRQHFTGKEKTYVDQVFSSGLDSASQFTLACSAHIHDVIGETDTDTDTDSSRVLMVPSGTAALEMAALLLEIQLGDEIIMPSYTFSSTANAFVLRGAVPVFVDVRRTTLNIDETLIEAAITPKTKAICVVHYAGVPCEMDTICSIASKHKLLVIEDAAQAYLSTYKGRFCGTIGDIGCFSFHYTKNVMCGEGGAVRINRCRERAKRAVVMWEKGTNRYDFMNGKIDKYEWVDIGSSFVPSELGCAVLWAQLQAAKEITAKRVAQHLLYTSKLQPVVEIASHKGIQLTLPSIPTDCAHNGHIYAVLLSSSSSPSAAATTTASPLSSSSAAAAAVASSSQMQRQAVRLMFEREFKARGISCFSHYVPLHSSAAGLKYGRAHGDMSETSFVFDSLLRLPMWVDMTEAQVDMVVNTLRDVLSSIQC